MTTAISAIGSASAKSADFKSRISNRNIGIAAAIAGGVAVVGAGFFFAREQGTQNPDYAAEASDGDFEIRNYPALLVAETVTTAPDRRTATGKGFRVLADYIFARSRHGEKIAMTAPVLSKQQPQDDGDSLEMWRTRFILPVHYTMATVPAPPPGITIAQLPARRVAVVRFGGMGGSETMAAKETALRQWLTKRGEGAKGAVEYGFYNSPMVPGPLRRNEVFLPLDSASADTRSAL